MKVAHESEAPAVVGQRGPVEHERREQIITAADAHFRRYGYDKTTVADLARAIGVSSGYVYRFFESKQAIGEAICGMTLGKVDAGLHDISRRETAAAERMRQVYLYLVDRGVELFFSERKLHDIVVAAMEANWCAINRHEKAILDVVRKIVADGREAGEFERKTPIDEVCRAIVETLVPFSNPALLTKSEREQLGANATAVASLVLRSLAP